MALLLTPPGALLGALLACGCGDNAGQAGPQTDAGALEAAPPDGGAADDAQADGDAALRVLFIGNSYTYANDLPGMLAQIAATAGTPPSITTDSVTQGGATLSDHWANGIAQARIAAEPWTHVVLQGQSLEALYPTDADFATYGVKWGQFIADAGAQPALFVTWARAAADTAYDPAAEQFVSPDEMQDRITDGYTDVAGQLPGSILACVGEAFRATLRDHPEIVLHQDDYSHPTAAGTYLAASTIYVALVGAPVPPASEVPDGVSVADAEALRAEALVGTRCAMVPLKAAVFMRPDSTWSCPVDFGTLGLTIPHYFFLTNRGFAPAAIADAHTLAAPFAWSAGDAFPGGAGTALVDGGQFQFCGASLEVGDTCVLAVSYVPGADGSSALTIDVTGAYDTQVSCALQAATTTRALLTVSEFAGFFDCTDATCAPIDLSCYPGGGTATTLVVSNRGGATAVALGPGSDLAPPFVWGTTNAGSGYPGGSGTATIWGVELPYCGATLEVGAQCLVTVGYFPPDLIPEVDTAVDLSYADAVGPVSPDARRSLVGRVSTLPP